MNPSLRRILAVALQTCMAAARLRLVLTGIVVLFLAQLALPYLVKHNGTARMFAQVAIAYPLHVTIAILSLTTLWLACSSLAGEIASGHLQMVALKPVPRWQIWLGKWLGIACLHALLLALALTTLHALLHLHARSLPPEQRAELFSSILPAHALLREPLIDLRPDIDALIQRRLSQPEARDLDPALVRQQMTALARARHETLTPNYRRVWNLPLPTLASSSTAAPPQLRIRFYAANMARTVTYPLVWILGDPALGPHLRLEKHLTAGVTHTFPLPPDLLTRSPHGRLDVSCENRSEATLLFRLEDSVELLLPVGGFTPNLARAGALILCWLTLLAAIGLAASSTLSFPTAFLASLALLYVGGSSATLREIVLEGTVFGVDHGHAPVEPNAMDRLVLPAFRTLHLVVDHLASFSPVSDLGSGHVIPGHQLLAAFLQIVVLAGGSFALAGILLLQRRQLGLPPCDS